MRSQLSKKLDMSVVRDNRNTYVTMAKKKKRKDKGALEYISPKHRKNTKALIRELGLELVSVTKTGIY